MFKYFTGKFAKDSNMLPSKNHKVLLHQLLFKHLGKNQHQKHCNWGFLYFFQRELSPIFMKGLPSLKLDLHRRKRFHQFKLGIEKVGSQNMREVTLC